MSKYSLNNFRFACYGVLAMGLLSCSGKKNIDDANVVVRYNDDVLTYAELRERMPDMITGLHDSAYQANRVINEWIDTRLLNNVASKNISNMEHINELVESYRNSLIAYEYRKQMIASHEKLIEQVSDDSIRQYYDGHKSEILLTEPIVKGVLIMVADNAPNIESLKKWIKRGTADDIEKIEKYCLTSTAHYDYFEDRWVAWQEIGKIIPYYFGNENDFVRNTRTFDISQNGFIYLLKITDFKCKGEIMPFDFAKSRIKEIFVSANQQQFEKSLIRRLYDEAIDDGDLVIYDSNYSKN